MHIIWNWSLDPSYVVGYAALFVAAVLILIEGLLADRKPGGWLSHNLPPQYLAPALVAACLPPIGFGLYLTLRLGSRGFLSFSTGLPAPNDILRTDMLVADPFSAFFMLIACVATVLVMLQSVEFFRERRYHRGEFYALLTFAALAVSLIAASADLVMIYLSLEMLSLISYALAAYLKNDPKSSEAGVKYFLFGAACSAMMIYGMSILFGMTGSTDLAAISGILAGAVGMTRIVWVGVFFVLVGFGFKLALVPFHLWAPDTYEGAPTPITAFLSVASKAAGIAVIVRFMLAGLPTGSAVVWFAPLAVLCALSMTLGNLAAIWQTNIKRMLAYSSIAQVGYVLIGLLAFASVGPAMPFGVRNWGLQGILIYVVAYLLMNLGAFSIVIHLANRTGSDEIESFSGMIRRAPFLSAALAFFFLSLAGIPPTAGFFGKFYVFGAAIQAGGPHSPALWWLAAIGVANSVVSIYYYFNVVRVMFFQPAKDDSRIAMTSATGFVVGATAILTLAIGVYPQPLIELARLSARMMGLL